MIKEEYENMKKNVKLPLVRDVLNCNTCFMKGKRNVNSFKIYGKKDWIIFVCNKCKAVVFRKFKRIGKKKRVKQ